MKKKYIVRLTEKERASCEATVKKENWQGVSLSRMTLAKQEWEVRSGQVYLLRRGELADRT